MTPRARALVFGALTVGTLDLLDAIVFSAFRGVAPLRVPQSIAAGLLGRAAFAGGAGTALAGIAIHYFIASSVVATYFLASRRLPSLTRHPLLLGPVYGLVVWVVMNYVVIPLSAITMPPLSAARLINGLGIHALGVGLPSALFARAAAEGSALPPRRGVEVL
jgi:hypothetical protein